MPKQVTKNQQTTQSSAPEDRAGDTKTIYDVSSFEIFWRNLIAGAGRALGGILLYAAFLFVTGYIFMQVIYPQFQPLINSYTSALDSLQQFNQPAPNQETNQNQDSNLNEVIKDPKFQQLLRQFQ